MSGFTPGPWVPRRAVKPDNTGGYDWAIIAPDKAIVAECFEVVDWAENGVDFDTRPVEANARLIAAAPDLLEALQAVVGQMPFTGNESEYELVQAGCDPTEARVLSNAFNAIAKANGAAS